MILVEMSLVFTEKQPGSKAILQFL